MTKSIESDGFERLRCENAKVFGIVEECILSHRVYRIVSCYLQIESWFCTAVKSIHKVVNTHLAYELSKESSQIRQSRDSLSFNVYTKVRPKKVTTSSNYNSLFLKTPIKENEWFSRLSHDSRLY